MPKGQTLFFLLDQYGQKVCWPYLASEKDLVGYMGWIKII